MDNLSHLLAGALVCDALPYTKKMGPRAPFLAAIAGAAPDLDMVPALVMNFPPKSLSFPDLFDMKTVMLLHRSYSHSFLYMTLAAIPLAWLAWRWNGKRDGWLKWAALFILAFYSHTILDLTNPWGVRAWLPFSNSRSAFDILPLMDIPILAIMAAVFIVNHVLRDSYPDPDKPADLKYAWRRRSAAFLDRRVGSTLVGIVGLALVAGRIALKLLQQESLAGWF